MSSSKVPVTVSYRKRGLAPPVFVAGTFSDPQWELQEMHGVIDESGEHHFTIQIPVEPGQEYRYKFKAANHDAWVLDEHATVVDDDLGQPCNLLKVPVTSNIVDRARTPLVEATERQDDGPVAPGQRTIVASGPKSLLPNVFRDKAYETDQRSGTPIKQVAEVAAEVADTAAKLDEQLDTTAPSPIPIPGRAGNAMAVEEEIATPLFAHESFGAYEFVDDGLEHDDFGKNPKSPVSMVSDSGCSLGDVDMDDPTLEKFPSDRSSVMDTLRKIQSSTDEGRSSFEDGQQAMAATPRTGMDSVDGNGGQLGLASTRKRDNRTSRSSFGRPLSTVSLGCIDEEPKTSGDVSPGTRLDPETRVRGTQGDGSTTDEENGLMMKIAKA